MTATHIDRLVGIYRARRFPLPRLFFPLQAFFLFLPDCVALFPHTEHSTRFGPHPGYPCLVDIVSRLVRTTIRLIHRARTMTIIGIISIRIRRRPFAKRRREVRRASPPVRVRVLRLMRKGRKPMFNRVLSSKRGGISEIAHILSGSLPRARKG